MRPGHIHAGFMRVFAPYSLAAMMVAIAISAQAQTLKNEDLASTGPAELIAIIKRNVHPNLDIVARMEAQNQLEQLGRQASGDVVPLLIAELQPPRSHGVLETHQRIAMIETLGGIGPYATEARPVLAEILQDKAEPNEWVGMAAGLALAQIGTDSSPPPPKSAQDFIAEGDYEGLDDFFRSLPDDRQIQLALQLMNSDDLRAAYLGAGTMVMEAPDDRNIARLVEVVLQMEEGPKALMGIAWSLMHGAGDSYEPTMNRLQTELVKQLQTASPEVQQRFQPR